MNYLATLETETETENCKTRSKINCKSSRRIN
jgi:hypothetical protein